MMCSVISYTDYIDDPHIASFQLYQHFTSQSNHVVPMDPIGFSTAQLQADDMHKVPEHCKIHGNYFGVISNNARRIRRTRTKQRSLGITRKMADGSATDAIIKLREEARNRTLEVLEMKVPPNQSDWSSKDKRLMAVINPIELKDAPMMAIFKNAEVSAMHELQLVTVFN